MSFRYQTVMVAFLGLVVHFHSVSSTGSISLAQSIEVTGGEVQAATTTTTQGDPNVPNLARAQSEELRKELRGKTANNNEYRIILERENLEPDSIAAFTGARASTVTRLKLVDGAGVPIECNACRETFNEPISEIGGTAKFKETATAIVEIVDKHAANKKAKEDEEKKLADSCKAGSFETQANCLKTKIAAAKESDKADLRDELFELLRTQLTEQGSEAETLSFLRSNRDVLSQLNRTQANAISALGAQYIAGKKALLLNQELAANVHPLFVAAMEEQDPRTRHELFARASQAAQRLGINRADAVYSQYQREVNSIFGTRASLTTTTLGVNPALRQAWETANLKNVAVLKTYADPKLFTAESLPSIAFMTDEYDIRGRGITNLNGSLSTKTDSLIDRADALTSRGGLRNPYDLYFGRGRDNTRPIIGGSNYFQDYIDRNQLGVQRRDMGNFGSDLSGQRNLTNPASTTAQSATPNTGRGGRRPTG